VGAVGDGVTSLAVGDHVVTLFSPECGACVNCRRGETNICVATREQQNAGHLPDGTARL
jgi:S-(hydroxymethyl)glutathione dehydrogenase/alcohol dehydrogenase